MLKLEPPLLKLYLAYIKPENLGSSRLKGGHTLVTRPRIVTPYLDSVDGTRDRVTHEKLVTR
jgi:hypothetical protein